jgi:hypothetical protein
MHKIEPARHEAPFFHEVTTGDDFETALTHAARQNTQSMDALHQAIKACVLGLRAEGMQCEAAMLTIKSCVRHIARKHSIDGMYNVAGSDLLMEQIVRWTITEFYTYD